MERVRSGDAAIFYEVRGSGPPVVLLHPFPSDHEFWHPVAAALESRYQLILPDLRGHGESEAGEGPAVMAKHALDVVQVLDAAGVGKATFVGCSIGGYILFEFWRRFRERVTALALCDTRPQADTAEARANRLQSAALVLEQGTEAVSRFADSEADGAHDTEHAAGSGGGSAGHDAQDVSRRYQPGAEGNGRAS